MLMVENLSTDQLWEAYSKRRTNDLYNELVVRYVYLVKKIAFRMASPYDSASNYDDLVSCGVFGLMDAIKRYDINRQVKFEYYASMRIKGEIIDYIRKQDWPPSSLRRKVKMISNAYEEMEAKLGRAPLDAEVAQALGLDETDLHKTMAQSHMFNVIHFEETLSEGFSWADIIQDRMEQPGEKAEKEAVREVLGRLIEELPEKERLVITLYYYEELKLKEIAGVLGVSESRVSQIHSKVLMKLKAKMQHAFTG